MSLETKPEPVQPEPPVTKERIEKSSVDASLNRTRGTSEPSARVGPAQLGAYRGTQVVDLDGSPGGSLGSGVAARHTRPVAWR
jgi:hypothetical protein